MVDGALRAKAMSRTSPSAPTRTVTSRRRELPEYSRLCSRVANSAASFAARWASVRRRSISSRASKNGLVMIASSGRGLDALVDAAGAGTHDGVGPDTEVDQADVVERLVELLEDVGELAGGAEQLVGPLGRVVHPPGDGGGRLGDDDRNAEAEAGQRLAH